MATTSSLAALLQWTLILVMVTSTCRALPESAPAEGASGEGSITAWHPGELHESPYFQALVQDLSRQAEMEKRAPKSSFFGVRGKKMPNNAFFGVRGKKDDDEDADYDWEEIDNLLEKRAPSAGFFGVRGKKRPSGFFGVRGKKTPAMNSFFGTRGKKSEGGDDEDKEEENEAARVLNELLLARQLAMPGEYQLQKKAPRMGFFGVRGKKDKGWETPVPAAATQDESQPSNSAVLN